MLTGKQTTAVKFVLTLAKALHRYGTPAHGIESTMLQVAEKVGLKAQFVSMPTSILVAFHEEEHQHTHVLRVSPGDSQLEMLHHMDQIAAAVIKGKLTPSQALARIRHYEGQPVRFGVWSQMGVYLVFSAAAARFFGGGAREIVTALGIGWVIGLIGTVGVRWETVRRVFPALAAAASAFLGSAFAAMLGPFAVPTSVVAGLIVLVPGMSLTVAITELATNNLGSGTARFMGAAAVFIQMGVGLMLGSGFAQGLFGPLTPVPPEGLPAWTEWLALALVLPAIGVCFQARPQDFPGVALAGALAYVSARFGIVWLGPLAGAFSAALVVGLVGNIYSRRADRPVALITVPGIILLVPGSMGLRGITSFLDKDLLVGLGTAFNTFMVGGALVSGLLFASLLVPPRKAL